MQQQIIEIIQTLMGGSLNSEELPPKIIGSVSILAALWLLRLGVIWLINYETDDIRIRYRWKKTTNYVLAIFGLILVGRIWIIGLQSAATFLGLVSAGLVIALQGPLTNLAGWIFILWRRPFEVGDRVQLKNYAGDVIDISLFQFTLLEIGNWVHADQSTGRILHMPNRHIFEQGVFNYTQGFAYIWHEIPVLITFESNWRKAKELLQEIANQQVGGISQQAGRQVKQASRRYPILYHNLTPIVYIKVESSGVLLTIRYISPVRRRRSSEQNIWEHILKAFAEQPDIEFAYPTQRFYTHGPDKQPGAVTFREKSPVITVENNAKNNYVDY